MNHSEKQPDKTNFIHFWLRQKPPCPEYQKFQHNPLSEDDRARDLIFYPLAETVFLHHHDPEHFRKNVIALGYPNLADAMKEVDRRPKNDKLRKGNFGEIIASEYLRQSEAYLIPVYRLRETSDDSPAPGEDILAFKLGDSDGNGRELLIGESKVRKFYSTDVIKKAYEQLRKAENRQRPKSFLFICDDLRKQGKDDEADQLIAFLNRFDANKPTRRSLLFLITGNAPRDPFRHIQDQEQVIKNLTATNLHLNSLDEFVTALFNYEVKIDGA